MRLGNGYLLQLHRRRVIAQCLAQLATCGFALWAAVTGHPGLVLLGISLSVLARVLLPRRAHLRPMMRRPRLVPVGLIVFYAVAFGILAVVHPHVRPLALFVLVPWMAFICAILVVTLLRPLPTS